jgi:hypothetical protein
MKENQALPQGLLHWGRYTLSFVYDSPVTETCVNRGSNWGQGPICFLLGVAPLQTEPPVPVHTAPPVPVTHCATSADTHCATSAGTHCATSAGTHCATSAGNTLRHQCRYTLCHQCRYTLHHQCRYTLRHQCRYTRESLVSDIAAGDGKTDNLFLQCVSLLVETVHLK